jgi:hypothetical protein
MSPIINPLFFYFISVTNVLRFLLLIGGFGVVIFVGFICWVDYDAADILKFLKKPLIIGLIVGTIGVFVPSENTCYKMLAASLITPDNIEVVKDGTQELVDYIIDVADQITEDDDDDDK